ncbi:MAG TPA: hypothetical protein DCX95_03145 [Elusimicrobia bacterium]|nr:hypothetical protein [Elusimicrobiota bacterium]
MKKLVLLLVGVAFLFAGCATVKAKLPGPKPLAKVVVHIGDTMRSAMGEEISVGGSKIFTAKGMDAENNSVSVGSPVWSATPADVVEIMPAVGAQVTVKGIKEGSADIVAESGGVKWTGTVYVR